jgi:hypothetical protein
MESGDTINLNFNDIIDNFFLEKIVKMFVNT